MLSPDPSLVADALTEYVETNGPFIAADGEMGVSYGNGDGKLREALPHAKAIAEQWPEIHRLVITAGVVQRTLDSDHSDEARLDAVNQLRFALRPFLETVEPEQLSIPFNSGTL